MALLQSLSYPFHDPVLTDRGFLSGPSTTQRAFVAAGGLGFVAIVLFGLIGLAAYFAGMEVQDDAPRAVAAAMGSGVLLLVNVLMLSSAGSTLDSALSSAAKAVDRDARGLLRFAGAASEAGSALTGRRVMVAVAVLGACPCSRARASCRLPRSAGRW